MVSWFRWTCFKNHTTDYSLFGTWYRAYYHPCSWQTFRETRTGCERWSRNCSLLSDAPATEHTPPLSNTPSPCITGHNNDPNDDSPITMQNYAPPTTDAATLQNPRLSALRTPTQPPTGSTTTPTNPPDHTHRPLSLPAPPDTAITSHLTTTPIARWI